MPWVHYESIYETPAIKAKAALYNKNSGIPGEHFCIKHT
jgi:hypothetical protein